MGSGALKLPPWNFFRLRVRGMHSVPRISRQLVIIICCIQVFQLFILSSYTLRLALNVKPFDVHEYLPKSVSLFRGSDKFSGTDLEHKPEDSKVYLLIPIHRPELQFCRCLRTHLLNGFNPILVNLGIDVGGDRANKYFKIRGVYNYIKRNPESIRPHDVIAIVDGFDAYSQLDPDTLIERFKKTGKRIFTGVDKNCFPNDPEGPVCNDIPQSEYSPDSYGPDTDKDQVWGDRRHTRPRWVNSGTIIGYFDALEELYDSMVNFSAPDDDHSSDQRVFAVHYYWGNFSMSLDFQSNLAVSVAFSEWELDFLNDPEKIKQLGVKPWVGTMKSGQTGQDEELVLQRQPIVRNRLMDTAPVFVHFPGIARGLMEEWEQKLWWTTYVNPEPGKQYLPTAKVVTDYVLEKTVMVAENQQTYTYNELCGMYVRQWGGLAEPPSFGAQ